MTFILWPDVTDTWRLSDDYVTIHFVCAIINMIILFNISSKHRFFAPRRGSMKFPGCEGAAVGMD
jgi:hypothetical protein